MTTNQAIIKDQRVALLAIILSAFVFVFDVNRPFEVASSLPYTLIVLLGLRLTQKRLIIFFAILATVLTLLGAFVSTSVYSPTEIFYNRMISLAVIWIAALIILYHKKNEKRILYKNSIIRDQSRRIKKQSEELDCIFNSVPAMIWYKDTKNNILRANYPAAHSMGLTCETIKGKNTVELYPVDAARYHRDDLEVIRTGKPKLNIIEPFTNANGDRLWAQTDKIPYRNHSGEIDGVIVFAIDVTERKKAEELRLEHQLELSKANDELKRMSTEDYLTGLLNRRGLDYAVKEVVRNVTSKGIQAYAALLDLDNFKHINHTFGYVMGDIVIKRVGDKLTEILDSDHRIGRIGGDEFMIFLNGVDEDKALSIAEQLRLEVSKMVVGMSSGEGIPLTTCLGMVTIQAHSISLEELIERSYFALSQGKEVGKNTVVYRDKIGVSQRDASSTMAQMLREDSDSNLFYVVKQPIINLVNRTEIGNELLTRLDDESYSMPKDFFKLAMESRVLTFIDRLCLKTCVSATNWMKEGSEVHLNVFPSTLIEVPVSQIIEEVLSGNQNVNYCIEISEQQIIGQPTHLIKAITQLKKAGIHIALDDIGFGSSCLESLILLEPNSVKIDQKCVRGLAMDAQLRVACRRLVDVLHSCDAEIVAEGIETEQDLQVLVDLGVKFGQGYLFSKPVRVLEGENTKLDMKSRRL